MTRIPSKEDILAWVSRNPSKASKRDIARAFGIKGAARLDLKRQLRELEAEGQLAKRRKTFRDPDRLPPVSVLQVDGLDTDGHLLARPLERQGQGQAPTILVLQRSGDPALAPGDRILARLEEVRGDTHAHEARVIRRIGTTPGKILGIFRKSDSGGRIVPIDKGASREWHVPPGADGGAKDGELVEAGQTGPRARLGLPHARIASCLGDPSRPRSVSLIAIHQHGLRDDFPDGVITEADAARPVAPGKRADLTSLPFVTIDPVDARDHDDAVWAEPDQDPDNAGGQVLWVAIADVAHYVRSGSAIDLEARERGNSTYFPDRVVPMLPDRLSGDLCSLLEGEQRPCIAARLVIDAKGELIAHEFQRALIRSVAALSYEEAQAALDGRPNERTEPLRDTVLKPLQAAHAALRSARERRQPLDLDLPEREIVLDEDGTVRTVAFKERLDMHRLIEEFMILANVAAARTLIGRRTPLLFRVHEEPSREKIRALHEVAKAAGLPFNGRAVLNTRNLNRLLAAAAGTDDGVLINLSVLRSMTQAYYSPGNPGHFGLALKAYTHFTSPIRRYADLVVHRALIRAHGWGDDGLTDAEAERLGATSEHVSSTERRSMQAERDTSDRYLATYMADRVGTELSGRISGVQRFGAFVELDGTGADGLIPVRAIGYEHFHFDRTAQTLKGDDTNTVISVGQRVLVRLAEAVPVTGGILLELLEIDGKPLPRARRSRMPARRKATRARKRAARPKRRGK
ncbi:MAG: ribonuclease R [Boseongicola sp. SB0675_bin_26]|nr:ribonuclease R [Boseongicola sp. SB0675_bin_26]